MLMSAAHRNCRITYLDALSNLEVAFGILTEKIEDIQKRCPNDQPPTKIIEAKSRIREIIDDIASNEGVLFFSQFLLYEVSPEEILMIKIAYDAVLVAKSRTETTSHNLEKIMQLIEVEKTLLLLMTRKVYD